MTEPLTLVDFHNHVMPGVDDGATDPAEAEGALRVLAEQGVAHVIATPHVDGSLTLRPEALSHRLREVDDAWATLQAVARAVPQIEVYRGAEVMLDTPEPDLSDDRLRLAGGRFALIEYPFMSVPPHSTNVLANIMNAGFIPIVAHPERYAGITPGSRLPEEWCGAGALLQVNAGSITGRYGPQARHNVLDLLERGLAHFVCSDFHARGRPYLRRARAALEEMGGAEHAELLMGGNPRRLLEGQHPLRVPPLRTRHGVLSRLRKWLR
ncbi:MAG TPA: CpsB/CapC family capsule biosynthesis tyrosine phosphatase [Longimicrobiales bacterium]|nr:CpsB/CapC family capsule biosynthesis tyrosine phosphatase [Longimicrobiales bacterium]